MCEYNSAVEYNVANVAVVGSIPTIRSKFQMVPAIRTVWYCCLAVNQVPSGHEVRLHPGTTKLNALVGEW